MLVRLVHKQTVISRVLNQRQKPPNLVKCFYALLCALMLPGCATFKTLDTDLPLNRRMFVYSGTRLDWSAITQNGPALRRMQIEPPEYPLVDLPFSLALDTLFFPLAAVAVVFE